MKPTKNIQASLRVFDALLAVFGGKAITKRECRRLAVISNCDLRPSTFFQLLDDAIALGFVAVLDDGLLEITVKGSAVVESIEEAHACVGETLASIVPRAEFSFTTGMMGCFSGT